MIQLVMVQVVTVQLMTGHRCTDMEKKQPSTAAVGANVINGLLTSYVVTIVGVS